MKSKLTAVHLRLILLVIMALLATLGTVLFVTGYGVLSNVAKETSSTATEAHQSSDGVEKVILAQRDLAANTDAIERASRIVSESTSYRYQDQIISDLNAYAQKAGVTITDISFTSAATGAARVASAAATSTAISGITPTIASVTVHSPVPYKNMVAFINYIEQSLTKMRISMITLSRSTEQGSAPGDVTSDILNIEVYLR